MNTKTSSNVGRGLRDRVSDCALRAFVGIAARTARPGLSRGTARASGTVLAGLSFAVLSTQPAQAQIIETWGSEMFTWVSSLDVNIVPLAITAGLLASMVAAMFSRMAGAVVFIFTVAGAFMYGTRDELISVAGGGG